MKNFTHTRPAFSMLEFVFVIVVIGILSSLIVPRLEKDNRQEAADSILSDIRYTQHLALNDDKHNINNIKWQLSFWQIGFRRCSGSTSFYEYIGSDMNSGGAIDNDESAIDPVNGKRMVWSGTKTCNSGDSVGDAQTSKRIFLTYNYGITNIVWGGSCSSAQYIAFDNLGRLHQNFDTLGLYRGYLFDVCTITFTLADGDSFSINIQPETGYAEIVNQPDS